MREEVALATQHTEQALTTQHTGREKQQFGICAAFAVRAYEDVLLVASDAETAAVADFHLRAPVGGVIVEEFHFVTVDGVLQVDERTLQYEKVVDFWQTFDAERVDFLNELLLDGRGGGRKLVGGELPAFEGGIKLTKHRLQFLLGEILASVFVVVIHILGARLYHFLHRQVVGEDAVFVAIDAVFFVFGAVGVGAEDFIGERHSAALAKFLFHILSYCDLVLLFEGAKIHQILNCC